MDPDGYYSLIFIFSGSFVSFLSANLSYLSQTKLKNALELGTPNAEIINKLRNRYEESLNSLLLFEVSLYIAGIIFAIGDVDINHKLLTLGSFLGITIISRIVFYFLGVRFADNIAISLAKPIYYIVVFGSFFPLIIDRLNTLTGGAYSSDEAKEEIHAVVDSAREDGSIDDDEYRILKSIMKFSDVKVEDVMTPRTVVFSCRADQTISQTIEIEELKNYSRIPVWEGDNIDKGLKGYVMTREVLYAALVGKGDRQLKELMKEIYMISEENALDEALEKFLTRQQHIMAVVDDYGGFEGLITMEDVLETIIGVEIVDEADQEMDLRELAKRRRDKRISKK
jgi:CBS domain containing-hemolysin-like protein